MKPRFYFEHIDSEICHTAEYFQDEMAYENLTSMEVFEAIPDKINGVFWCKIYTFCGDDTSDTCGKQCKEYDPKNKINGCCKHHTSWIYLHGDKTVLTPPINK